MSNPRHTLESALTRAWLRRGGLALVLWPLSLLFRALVALRRSLYGLGILRSTRLPVPVIVVGNLFVGGTGKTPFVIWLANALKGAGHAPGIVSRGHGADNGQTHPVTPASSPEQAGDEPLLIAQRTGCPVVVGRDRAAAGLALLAAHPAVNVLISDDGLQHYALQRDVEIVLFDDRGVGNGWMLPAGPLREPASRQRDFTVINGTQVPAGLENVVRMQLSGGIAEKLGNRSQLVPLADLPKTFENEVGRPPRLLAAAGIGNPARFFDMLRQAGLSFEELSLPDHFDYKISPFGDKDADFILITEKDAVKCALFEPPENMERLWVVPVTAHLDAAMAERIVEKCRGSRIA